MVAGVLVGLLAVLAVVRLADARRDLKAAEQAFLEAKAAIAETRTDDAEVSLEEAEGKLAAAALHADSFPLGLLRPIPLLGSPVKAVSGVADAGEELVAGGRVINDAAASFPTAGGVGIDGHDLSGFHRAALDAEGALVQAEAHVRRAAGLADGPAGAFLPMVSGPGRSLTSTIDDALTQLDGAERGLALLADLAAPTTDARILLLAQDTLELNATGGYIGSYGVLEFRRGRVDLTEYAATEDLPPPVPARRPPEQLGRMLPGEWRITHANYWPDFPTSAVTAADLFRGHGKGEVDGVVAITEEVLADVLEAFGPMEVPGYDPVGAEGLGERIVHEVELKRPLDTPRKKFLIELSEVVLDRLFSATPDELAALAGRLAERGGSGRIQLWFADPERQALIAGSALAGELPQVEGGDFLALVEMSAQAGKANQHLERDVQYRVTRDGASGDLIASLEIRYHNRGVETVVNPYYAGYLRVYAPAGSQLLDEGVHVDEGLAPDGRYQVFASGVRVEPEGQARVSFAYRLPKTVSASDYELTWLRQAGTPNDTLTAAIGGRTVIGSPLDRVLEVSADLQPNPVAVWVQRLLE